MGEFSAEFRIPCIEAIEARLDALEEHARQQDEGTTRAVKALRVSTLEQTEPSDVDGPVEREVKAALRKAME